MQRPVYQVCDSSSCSKKMKVKRRTPLRLLVAEFRLVACSSQVPHRVRRLTSYSQEAHKKAQNLYASTHRTIC